MQVINKFFSKIKLLIMGLQDKELLKDISLENDGSKKIELFDEEMIIIKGGGEAGCKADTNHGYCILNCGGKPK